MKDLNEHKPNFYQSNILLPRRQQSSNHDVSNLNNEDSVILNPVRLSQDRVNINSLQITSGNIAFQDSITTQYVTNKISVILPTNSELKSQSDIKKTFQANHNSAKRFCNQGKLKLFILILSLCAVVVLSGFAVYIYLCSWLLPANGSSSSGRSNVSVVTPEEWGILPNLTSWACCPLTFVNWVVVYPLPLKEPCTNQQQCSEQVRQRQYFFNSNFTRNQRALRENFIIGGDNRVYVGKGWDRVQIINNVKIGIFFDNVQNVITERQAYLIQVLISVGRHCGKILDNFKVEWRCGQCCKQNENFTRVMDLNQADQFNVYDLDQFTQDSLALSQPICEGKKQTCDKVNCILHYNTTCVQCHSG